MRILICGVRGTFLCLKLIFNIFIYSYFIGVIFVVILVLGLWFYYLQVDLIIEWLVYRFNSSIIEIYILVDWISCLFIRFVLIISSMVIVFSVEYIKGDRIIDRFIFLVIMFIISILIMILSPSLVRILFGWDILGLISYCLVVYYQRRSSYNSGIVTVLSNRLGDVGLLMAVGLVLMFGRWNIYLLEKGGILLIFILIASITKRAQIPFSTWLPMAMAAPTPVSSLVHSSTLVTAGVYLVFRFRELLVGGGSLILIFISVFTIFISGLMANFEFDLKKIIALSTLSQLGLMMIIMGLGFRLLGFFHLLIHAIFKSLLFLCAGSLIHLLKDNQDIRKCGFLGPGLPFVFMRLNVSIISLMGFPFISGFYSKDLIIEVLYTLKVNFFLFVFIVLSVSLTVIYSLRLCYYLNFFGGKLLPVCIVKERGLINFSMIFLMFIRIVRGSVLSWIFFFDLEIVFLPLFVKLFTLILVILGGLVVLTWLKRTKRSGLKSGLMLKRIVYYNSFIWIMNFVHIGLNKFFLNIGNKVIMVDSNWIEFIEVSSWINLKFLTEKFYYLGFNTLFHLIFRVIILVVLIFFFEG